MNYAFTQHPLKRRANDSGTPQIWDPIRREWVADQPEEEVRQQLLQYLLIDRNIPRGLIGVEKEIRYQRMRRRFDLLVFDAEGKAHILIEIKAPDVPLSEKTLQQLARYNLDIQAPHLIITNGHQLLFFSRQKNGSYQFRPSGWKE